MKNSNEMFNSLLERRDRYITEQRKKRKAVIRTAAPVCCLCLVVMLGVGIWQSGLSGQPDVPIQGETSGQIGSSVGGTTDTQSSSSPAKGDEPGQNSSSAGGAAVAQSPSSSAKDEYAVYTDSVKLPENTSGVEDMLGCLVYKGKVYTQSTLSARTRTGILAHAEQLVGEYVGEAKGTLDEWSSQEEWATEFASTYSGPVYKVNGYSEDFRLCIYVDFGGEQWLQLLDNYDGIGLNTGADLFEKRLHVTGNVESVTYRTHSDWNKGVSNYQDLVSVTEEQFEQFLTELCESPFVRISAKNDPNFYDDAETQGHLYLNMKDGSVIVLRLIEGGYVGCQNLNWIFVKMPGELFDLVLGACQ